MRQFTEDPHPFETLAVDQDTLGCLKWPPMFNHPSHTSETAMEASGS